MHFINQSHYFCCWQFFDETFIGHTGSTGQPGQKGAIGATGVKGSTGDSGADGQPGESGATGKRGKLCSSTQWILNVLCLWQNQLHWW